MNLAERIIIKGRNYWLKKGYNLMPHGQTILIKKFALMFEREEFKQNCKKFTPYQVNRNLIKSARLKVGEMIKELSQY